MYNVYNEPVTRISINFIVSSVNFSCSNFDELELSENYLDNLNKIKNIIYYLESRQKNQKIIRILISNEWKS